MKQISQVDERDSKLFASWRANHQAKASLLYFHNLFNEEFAPKWWACTNDGAPIQCDLANWKRNGSDSWKRFLGRVTAGESKFICQRLTDADLGKQGWVFNGMGSLGSPLHTLLQILPYPLDEGVFATFAADWVSNRMTEPACDDLIRHFRPEVVERLHPKANLEMARAMKRSLKFFEGLFVPSSVEWTSKRYKSFSDWKNAAPESCPHPFDKTLERTIVYLSTNGTKAPTFAVVLNKMVLEKSLLFTGTCAHHNINGLIGTFDWVQTLPFPLNEETWKQRLQANPRPKGVQSSLLEFEVLLPANLELLYPGWQDMLADAERTLQTLGGLFANVSWSNNGYATLSEWKAKANRQFCSSLREIALGCTTLSGSFQKALKNGYLSISEDKKSADALDVPKEFPFCSLLPSSLAPVALEEVYLCRLQEFENGRVVGGERCTAVERQYLKPEVLARLYPETARSISTSSLVPDLSKFTAEDTLRYFEGMFRHPILWTYQRYLSLDAWAAAGGLAAWPFAKMLRDAEKGILREDSLGQVLDTCILGPSRFYVQGVEGLVREFSHTTKHTTIFAVNGITKVFPWTVVLPHPLHDASLERAVAGWNLETGRPNLPSQIERETIKQSYLERIYPAYAQHLRDVAEVELSLQFFASLFLLGPRWSKDGHPTIATWKNYPTYQSAMQQATLGKFAKPDTNFVDRFFDAVLKESSFPFREGPTGRVWIKLDAGKDPVAARNQLLDALPWMKDLPYPLNPVTYAAFLQRRLASQSIEELGVGQGILDPERLNEIYPLHSERQELKRYAQRLADLPEAYFLDFVQTYANKRAKRSC